MSRTSTLKVGTEVLNTVLLICILSLSCHGKSLRGFRIYFYKGYTNSTVRWMLRTDGVPVVDLRLTLISLLVLSLLLRCPSDIAGVGLLAS